MWVCKPCNNRKSQYDNDLRNVLVGDVRCHNHPEAQNLIPKAERGLPKISVPLRQRIIDAKPRALHTLGGLYEGEYSAFALDSNTEDCFRLMVKGMYFKASSQVFPQHYRMAVTNSSDQINTLDHLSRQPGGNHYGPFILGDDVCRYTCYYSTLDTATSIWLLRFYQRFYVAVLTGGASETNISVDGRAV